MLPQFRLRICFSNSTTRDVFCVFFRHVLFSSTTYVVEVVGHVQATFKKSGGVKVIKAAVKEFGGYVFDTDVETRCKAVLKAAGADSWFD